jgi:uncharacterized protein (TIGR03437 family)
MQKLHLALIFLGSASLLSRPASAQPTIAANGIRNSASYALPGLPNAGIAKGSIFVIFGQNLGPAKILQVSSFPLPSSSGLAGTSIQITVNGTSVYAIMLYTLATQVAAVLPSDTPIGTGTVTVTYNGQTSNQAPITVVKSTFGIFAVNQSGSGPGVLQNVNSQTDRPFNSPSESAQPGQVIILWGTGLGPVTGEEDAGPLPGDMPNLNIHVFVGGVEAKIQYRGRSGCCVGDDQIVLVVPSGVEGCALPVYVQIDNVLSNFVTMSVGNGGSACQDPSGLTGSLLATAQKNGGLKLGTLAVGRFISESSGTTRRNDNLSATFESIPLASLGAGAPTPTGTCTVAQFPSGAPYPPAPTGLDAGTVTVATPVGTYPVPPVTGQPGDYLLTFFPAEPTSSPGIINNGTLLTPGTVTFTFTGGAVVAAGSGSINFPLTFVWTNDSSVTSIDRSQPLTITWSGGTSGAVVNMYIQSQVSVGVGAELSCAADATLGTFTISQAFLSALPPSYTDSGGNPQGGFSIVEQFIGSFTNASLDLAQTQFTDTVDKGPMPVH